MLVKVFWSNHTVTMKLVDALHAMRDFVNAKEYFRIDFMDGGTIVTVEEEE